MKILSYNIHKCTQEKIDKLCAMDADILVLPECSYPDFLDNIPEGYHYVHWEGHYWEKGFAVLAKYGLKCEMVPWYDRTYPYNIPLIINDQWLLLGMWPTVLKEPEYPKYTYPQILLETLKGYKHYLEKYATLICGDFNCYMGQRANKATGRLQDSIDLLERIGYRSLYHSQTGEAFGKESECTYHHQFKEDKRFFLDYAFSNIPQAKLTLLPWDKEISDHNGLLIEI